MKSGRVKMQAAANRNRILTGCSSKVGLADSDIGVSHGGLLRHAVARHLYQTVHSQDVFVKLTSELVQFAEHAFTLRDLNALEEVSQILMNLPVDAAREIGTYYFALAINRKGERGKAEDLLEEVADNAPITYRARAVQTLGANYLDKGQLNETLRFQLEALRMASDREAHGLQTTLMARWEIAIIKSLEGDHRGALSDLRSLSPIVGLVAKQKPFYFYFFCNDLAVTLGELGRTDEAQATLEIALASPYASAYPNWAETRQELAAKRTSATPSVVPVRRTAEGIPASRTQPRPCQKLNRVVAFCSFIIKETAIQIALILIAAFKAIADRPTRVDILDQLGRSFRARAPPPQH